MLQRLVLVILYRVNHEGKRLILCYINFSSALIKARSAGLLAPQQVTTNNPLKLIDAYVPATNLCN